MTSTSCGGTSLASSRHASLLRPPLLLTPARRPLPTRPSACASSPLPRGHWLGLGRTRHSLRGGLAAGRAKGDRRATPHRANPNPNPNPKPNPNPNRNRNPNPHQASSTASSWLASSQDGHCGTTAGPGDCATGDQGSWPLAQLRMPRQTWSHAVAACLRRCARCKPYPKPCP